MKKAQSKNITGLLFLSLVFLFVGEGVFSAALYWPFLLALSVSWRNTYWYVFLFGLLLSLVTVTPLGLASLILLVSVFIFSKAYFMAGENLWLMLLLVGVISVVADLLLFRSLSLVEVAANVILVFLLWRLNFFDNDLALRRTA